MNNKLEVIGIDHGWSMMKTISQVLDVYKRQLWCSKRSWWN